MLKGPNMFNNLRVSNRFVSFAAILLMGAMLLSSMSCSHKASMVNSVVVEDALAFRLANLSAKIDARVGQMKLISKSLANDTHIHAWANGGFDAQKEPLLLEKLGFFVQEYDLTSASFADKNTHKYWNHEGFLRELTPEADTWYYAYLESGNQDLVSVYHDQNKKRVDLYVNYQQIDGNGLSGIATSFTGVLDTLNNSVFAKHGTVYLVDVKGNIHMQNNSLVDLKTKAEQSKSIKTLQALFDDGTVTSILNKNAQQDTRFITLEDSGGKSQMLLGSSYIPSMGWFLVAHVSKDALGV